ncbi:MAG: endopeptidase La [candidate division KSB1 bacterium]|nr:endopeptidase La [candidate division KSB1 bacterium]MDZ7273594.1 endopeptidase La [candidate division KSB1 bacterium]MDZ7286815.1 endopeptidase La [candidate division KSB1 bacterium]MDZ7299828.1 endopeptidase La [candidate division KSB1 bacterium]MDZ7309265.1 endopeptidase La [candidate division KSB1 bacterium]
MSKERDSDDPGIEIRIPKVLPLLPLRNTVIFPQQILPLSIGREKSVRLIEAAMRSDRLIMVVAQKDGAVDDPGPEDLYRWGTIAQVMKIFKMPDGTQSAMVQGVARARLLDFLQTDPYLTVAVQPYPEGKAEGMDIDAMVVNLRAQFQKAVDLAPYLTPEHTMMVMNAESPGRLADIIVWNLNIPMQEKQDILEITDIRRRLERTTFLLSKELQILELGSKIQSEVQGEISKNQREYYLREQLKAIKRELGEDEDERTSEINELRQKLEEAKLPEEARKVAEKELDRLARIPPAAAEYTVSRTYLDWLIELPWSKETEDNLDVNYARVVLDEDHYNLEKVKRRILEYLAVRQLKPDMKGPILCFVGPPGVGKTSLGRSIARAMGRKFVRISLGGVHDEAEIRGHRRTYIGALPGRIIQGLKKAGVNNPIFMLDEIDKVGADFRGDPSSALLEVLDPEQNFSFSDHYLEVPFDLSKVMFIATANLEDPIHPALKDRLEIIELPGYTAEDKMRIAEKFLVPKQLEAHGLKPEQVTFEPEAIEHVISAYTREAGVRNLEREIANICRGVAREIVESKGQENAAEIRRVVTRDSVQKYLGVIKYFSDAKERTSRTGVATGLAWTAVGGDILFVEATKMRGKGGLTLTGHLGDVMKESAMAALSYIRSKAKQYEIDEDIFDKTDIHIHVPAGAIPKDGPSAGVTMFVALMSLLTDRTVAHDYAMTGEITLRGLVLPVGGIKEKALAAKRAGINKVILPEKNRKDIEEIPQHVREQMQFYFVSEMDDVIKIVLGKRPRKPKTESAGVAEQHPAIA